MMYYIRAARVHNLGERMIQKVHGENMDHGFGMIGYMAALLTTFSSIPQIVRVCRLKESRDISLWTVYPLYPQGVLLWAALEIISAYLLVIIANVVSLCLSVMLICLVVRYR